jgi:death on curing protein
MTLLSLEHLLEIHAIVIQETGCSAGLRDLGRLESVIATQSQNVFGEELYPTAPDKAAALTRGIIADHPFVDGNKRTAMLAGLSYVKLNGLKFKAQAGEIEDFAVRVAVDHLSVQDIASWLNEHIT